MEKPRNIPTMNMEEEHGYKVHWPIKSITVILIEFQPLKRRKRSGVI